MTRSIVHRYDDPLDLIWLACARTLGFEIARAEGVYASFDGDKTLSLCTRQHFDLDDSLAQLILHELCHALVAGPRGARRADWGMENADARDLLQEHACHRLQAALADRHGLRALFAVTTEHRPYWDALPLDPLALGADPAIAWARAAWTSARAEPWASALERALAQTAKLAETMRELDLPADSLWRKTRPLHASGFALADDASARCDECAWSYAAGSRLRCRKAPRARLGAGEPACVRFEPKLEPADCAACGACCREGFDRVELRAREPARKQHATLVVVDAFGPHLPRPGGRCVALSGGEGGAPYRCRIYPDRPRACASFEIAGDACLSARRRVGLSA